MQHSTSIRTFKLDISLRPEERGRLDREAQKHGISRAEVLRRACPEVFTETGVKVGRVTGVSPGKLG